MSTEEALRAALSSAEARINALSERVARAEARLDSAKEDQGRRLDLLESSVERLRTDVATINDKLSALAVRVLFAAGVGTVGSSAAVAGGSALLPILQSLFH